MKVFLLTLLLSVGLVSCGPSLSEDNQVRLKKKVDSKTMSYIKHEKEKLVHQTFSPSDSSLVSELDLSVDEKNKLAKEAQAASMLGAEDIEFHRSKYHLQVNYQAPNDGFVSANDQYFSSKEVLDSYVAQEIKNQTTKKVCTKKERPRHSFRDVCVKHKTVKLEDAAKKENEIRNRYSNPRVYKAGDGLAPKDYILSISSVKHEGKEQFELNLSEPSEREIASL